MYTYCKQDSHVIHNAQVRTGPAPASVASPLTQAGVSLFKIATLMGNSPEICRRHYAALTPEVMVAEVEFSGQAPRHALTGT